MRLRVVVLIALLAVLASIVGSTAVAPHANASNVHAANNVGFELQAPQVAGSSDAMPISTSSLRSTSLFATLALCGAAAVSGDLVRRGCLALDARIRAAVRPTRRRRAPPLLLV